MPETRYAEEYRDGKLVRREPYEVSDEELAQEQEDATCEEYLHHSPDVITQPQMWFLIRALAKELGYRVE